MNGNGLMKLPYDLALGRITAYPETDNPGEEMVKSQQDPDTATPEATSPDSGLTARDP